jgi:hypothetical protein
VTAWPDCGAIPDDVPRVDRESERIARHGHPTGAVAVTRFVTRFVTRNADDDAVIGD